MEEYIGIIKIFGGNFAPRGWAMCQGQLLSIATNTALFSILGTMYGGNGQTTFALPDLRGRMPIGMNQGPGLPSYTQAEIGGTATVTLSTNNIPPHNHVLTGTVQMPCSGDSNTDSPEGAYLASAGSNIYNSASDGEFMGSLTNTLAVGITGNGLPVAVQNPYMAINYIICTEGMFPSRN